MKKIMENVNLKEFTFGKIKEILWKLCYNPIETLKMLDVENEDVLRIRENILSQCYEKGRLGLFGHDVFFADTVGVDLGIKDPIIRDILLEKCYYITVKGNDVLKIIRLLKTENNGSEYSEKRIIGGLKAMGFSNEEANYLFRTCNLYPIALLLDKLDKRGITKSKEIYRVMKKDDYEYFEERPKKLEDENLKQSKYESNVKLSNAEPEINTTKTKKISHTVLIDKKAEIEKVYTLLKDEKSVDEIKNSILTLREELSRLEQLDKLLIGLNNAGITLDELLNKRKKLEDLFKVMEEL